MRTLLLLLFGLPSINVVGQNGPNSFDVRTWQPPYNLIIPSGWTPERFAIPIDFAPQIPYKGVEDIRFAPGWNNPASEGYWSYTYLWWLEGKSTINATDLQQNLTAYYAGLVGRNITSRHIPASKTVPTTVVIDKVTSTDNESEVYRGTITMLDYMSQNPIRLTCLIHVKRCPEQQRTAVLFEVSPKPVDQPIWQRLHVIRRDFACQK